MLLANFGLIPLVIVLIFNVLAFGHVGVVLTILAPIGMVTQADPTLPRRVRAEVLSGVVTVLCPFAVGMWSGFAACFALTPQFFGLCSTRDPRCAAAAHLFAGLFAAIALLWVVDLILALQEYACPDADALVADAVAGAADAG